jgi:hypothetical protein
MDASDSWPELPDSLREAIRQVRAAPIPRDAERRALERAREIGRPSHPPRSWPTSRRLWLAAGAVAALVMLGLSLQHRHQPGHPDIQVEKETFPVRTLVYDRPTGTERSSRVPWVDHKDVEAFLLHTGAGEDRGAVPPLHGHVLGSDGSALTLMGVNIQIVIEGSRARTLVDSIFRNLSARNFSGVFESMLPQGASPCCFALFPGESNRSAPRIIQPGGTPTPRPITLPDPDEYVQRIDPHCWGKPRPGCVVRVRRQTEWAYESLPDSRSQTGLPITRFRCPLREVVPKGFVRVVLAYEEDLPLSEGKIVYHHALPTCQLQDLSVTVQVDARLLRQIEFSPADAGHQEIDGKVIRTCQWKRPVPGGAVRFEATGDQPAVQATSGRYGRSYYLHARIHPTVSVPGRPSNQARHAIFLLDTSAGEDSRRFERSLRLLRAILENDPAIESFNVMMFSTAPAWLEPGGFLPNTPAGRARALTQLDGLLLEGATDLSTALERVAEPGWTIGKTTPIHCFLLSDGRPTWGETDPDTLVAHFESRCSFPVRWHCYRMFLGQENTSLFATLTRRGGGVHPCRSLADLPVASLAHRQPCLIVRRLRFEGGPAARDLQVAGRRSAVQPGGDLVVAARFAAPGATRLMLEGELDGKEVKQSFPIEIADGGQLAARGWAELAVPALLAINDPDLDSLAAALAQEFRVVSRLTTFALCDPGAAAGAAGTADKLKLAEVLRRAQAASPGEGQTKRLRALLLAAVRQAAHRRELMALFGLASGDDLTLPPVRLAGPLVRRDEVPAAYLAGRDRDPGAVRPYLDEAQRRVRAGDGDGAVRVLSSLLEQGAERGEAARLVSSRLLALDRPELAARLMLAEMVRDPEDPANHRGLAVSLSRSRRLLWAALHYQAALELFGRDRTQQAAVLDEYTGLLRSGSLDIRLPGPLRASFRIALGKVRRVQRERRPAP